MPHLIRSVSLILRIFIVREVKVFENEFVPEKFENQKHVSGNFCEIQSGEISKHYGLTTNSRG